MRLLLDTHAFLWTAGSPDALSAAAREAIEDTANEVFVSAAVAWEVTIKTALGKLTVPVDPAIWFPERIRSLGFAQCHITASHALAVGALPPIHNDPFDRVMIAQAQLEGFTFVTRDPQNLQYPIALMPA